MHLINEQQWNISKMETKDHFLLYGSVHIIVEEIMRIVVCLWPSELYVIKMCWCYGQD